MALDFPSSPTNGQVYTDTTTGNKYTYDGAYALWRFTGGSSTGLSVNTTVMFNDSDKANGSLGFTFTKTTNNVSVANNVNAASFTTSGVTANTSGLYPASNTVGDFLGSTIARWELYSTNGFVAGAVSGITTLAAGNTTVTGFVNASVSVNSALLTVGALFTANSTLVNAAALNVTGQVNTATLYATTTANVGTLLRVNTTAFMVSTNSTVNTIITATSFTQANTTATPFVANVTGLYHTGLVNAAAFTTTGNANAAVHYAGANVYMNATTVFVSSNSTMNTVITANQITLNGANVMTTATTLKVYNSAGTLVFP